jgi:hypothetical protein
MLPGYPAGVAATSPPYPTSREQSLERPGPGDVHRTDRFRPDAFFLARNPVSSHCKMNFRLRRSRPTELFRDRRLFILHQFSPAKARP